MHGMRSLSGSLALLSLLAVGSQVHADDKAIQKALIANYAKFDQAFLKNNLTAFLGMLTPDYAHVEANGQRMDRTAMIASFKSERAAIQSPVVQSKLQSLSTKDNQIVATVQEHLSGIMADPRSKEPHKLEIDATSKDTWVKQGSVWKLKLDQVITQTILVDGKPLGGTTGGKARKVGK